jgi:hypothetical protein
MNRTFHDDFLTVNDEIQAAASKEKKRWADSHENLANQ